MSSFSSLFGAADKKAGYDEVVSNLFSSSADGPVSRDQLKSSRTVIDIPQQEEEEEDEDDDEEDEDENEDEDEDDDSEEDSEEEEDDDDESNDEEVEVPIKKTKKKDADDDLEDKYYAKLLKDDAKDEPQEDKESEDDDEEEEAKDTKNVKGKKATAIELKESEIEKAERTVFVGNLTAEVLNSKQIAKKLKQLFGQVGKIESVRYRSIAFEENLPRKIAVAKKNLHKSRDTLNAYIVFKDKAVSLKAVAKFNATVFENFHLRVDHIAHPSPKDNKRTIFVGNLDFEEKEETLWRYFNSKLDNDVESVRVIRDSKTNVGKGFALVQFKDTLSVNKALFLNDKPLINEQDTKKKARKLRISRANSHAKPSILSPNHIDNVKKSYASNKSKLNNNLSEQQKVKIGRGKSILGKADKSAIGKVKRQIVEGHRAAKGQPIVGIKGLKTGKVKKPRIRDRSTQFKKEREQIKQDFVKKDVNSKPRANYNKGKSSSR
ncbi:uncharacterized protein RJT21DRAFT_11546 [Scheffersomyces amazonensis]|uniref:uncharacterized protein n=1 Tax=Scheffersomyces amazonensis TaxID=1078765 RepID=UPI00315DB195